MTGFGKAVLSALLASVVLVAGAALADTQSFDLDAIEVQDSRDQAIIAMDVPGGSEIKAIDNAQRGELTVTFTGVSVRLPKRVHSGANGALVSSVDVEPWFIDGERVTRMVIRYPEGAHAEQGREGDVLTVTIDAPEGQTTDDMNVPTADTAADEMSSESDVDDVATANVPETWTPGGPSFMAAPVAVEAPHAEARSQDTAPEVVPATDKMDEAEAEADDFGAEMLAETEKAAEAEFEEMTAEMKATTAATAHPTTAQKPAATPAPATTVAPAAPVAQAAQPVAQAPAPVAQAAAQPVSRASWYGQETQQVTPVSSSVAGWPAESMQDTQPELPDMDAGPTITIDLQGADIRTVLRSLSETSGWNIVANSDVSGEVSLKLDDVPWRRALAVVLKTRDLGYVVEDGIIRVAKADALRAEVISREAAARKKDELVPLETSVVPVRFAAAAELMMSVQTLLSPRGKIKEDTRTNSLIVTDIPSILPQVTGLVTRLDGKTPQVEIVAKLVDIDVSAVREMGINWGLTNLHSTGQALSGNANVSSPIGAAAGTVNFGVIREFGDLDLTLQALEQNQKANIISNPKISTVNNREARILVGQEIPLIVQDEAGNPITELKKIGIELRVTPYINQDGLITLDLHPQVSDLASQSTAQGGVIINTSEADTRVMVADGETAVIGGLIRANQTSFKTGVPVLHRLPIIGGLFGSESKSDAKRELVIFVTPRIIE